MTIIIGFRGKTSSRPLSVGAVLTSTSTLLLALVLSLSCRSCYAFLTSPMAIQRISKTQSFLKSPLRTRGNEVSSPEADSPETRFFDAFQFGTISSDSNNKKTESLQADLTQFLRNEGSVEPIQQQSQEIDFQNVAVAGVTVLVASIAAATSFFDISLPGPSDVLVAIQSFFADPTSSLQEVVKTVESMGPLGAFYFWFVYLMADLLAIPAFPLTASAGYLFGVAKGTAIVLAAASIAAAASFVIGRTLLRSYVEEVLEGYPEFKKIDNAIGKEGFKLMLLLRLSPIFPFALSNYLYGASKIRFWPYFFGTMLGFTPGTIAYVYGGEVGKALTIGGSSAQPWYIYLGGFALFGGFLKVIADVATGIIEEIQEEDS